MESSRVSGKSSSQKKPSVIDLSPHSELVFEIGDVKSMAQVSSQLTISNPTAEALCFKVKTTAPKEYCVRPNSGTLDPRSSVNINVMLQPPLPKGGVSKDKFLVQTVMSKDVDDVNSPDMWKTVGKSVIMENRLKCKWNFTSEDFAGGTLTDGSAPQPKSPVVSTPSSSSVVADKKPSPQVATTPSTTSSSDARKTSESKLNVDTSSKSTLSSRVSPSSSTSTVSTRKPSSSSTSSASLSTKASSSSSSTAVAKQTTSNPEQVPSIILLLAVFLLGYIFGKFVL